MTMMNKACGLICRNNIDIDTCRYIKKSVVGMFTNDAIYVKKYDLSTLCAVS